MANNGATVVLDDEVNMVMNYYTLSQFIKFFDALNLDLTNFNTNNVTKLVDSSKFIFQTRFGIPSKPINISLQITIMLVALNDPDLIGSENSIRNKLRRIVNNAHYFNYFLRDCIPIMNENTVIREILQTELLDVTGEPIDPNAVHGNIGIIIQQNKRKFIENVDKLINYMREIISSGYLNSVMLHTNTIQKLKSLEGKKTYKGLTHKLFNKTKGSYRTISLITNYVGQVSPTIQRHANNKFLSRSTLKTRSKARNGTNLVHRSISDEYLELIQLLSFKTNQATPHYYIPFRDTSGMTNVDNIIRTKLNNTRTPLLEVNLHLRQKFNVFKKGETHNSVIAQFIGNPVICLTSDNKTYIFPVFTGIQIIQSHDRKQGVRVNYRNTFGERTLDIFHNCVMALLQPKPIMNALSHSLGFPETSTPQTQRFQPTRNNNSKRRRLEGGNRHKKVHAKQTRRKKNNSKKGKRKTMNKHKNKY